MYTLSFQKVGVDDIHLLFVSYYGTNGMFFDKARPWKFKQRKRDTPYEFKGNYGLYVDRDDELLKITGISPPPKDCNTSI